MSKTVHEKLNEKLDIANSLLAENDTIVGELVEDHSDLMIFEEDDTLSLTDLEEDYKRTRKNVYDLLEKANKALDDILLIANETEHPRAYEVATQLINSISNVNKELLETQKKLMEIKNTKGNSKQQAQTINNNAIFTGTPKELLEHLNTHMGRRSDKLYDS